jgi:hypothetical protein
MKIVNISGEPREYKDYELLLKYPFPADAGTETPDDIAEKLIATGFFKAANEKPKKR